MDALRIRNSLSKGGSRIQGGVILVSEALDRGILELFTKDYEYYTIMVVAGNTNLWPEIWPQTSVTISNIFQTACCLPDILLFSFCSRAICKQ